MHAIYISSSSSILYTRFSTCNIVCILYDILENQYVSHRSAAQPIAISCCSTSHHITVHNILNPLTAIQCLLDILMCKTVKFKIWFVFESIKCFMQTIVSERFVWLINAMRSSGYTLHFHLFFVRSYSFNVYYT